MINGAPKVKSSTVDFDENFILVPLPIEWRPSLFFRISLANFAPNRFTQNRTVFVANINSTFMQDIFNLAET